MRTSFRTLFFVHAMLFAGLLAVSVSSGRASADEAETPTETVRLPIYTDLNLDPHRTQTLEHFRILGGVYEGLMRYTSDGIEPCLARETPSVSEDGLTWTFKLRRGVRFHNSACFPAREGPELRAGDVVASLKRLARSKGMGWLLAGQIEGWDEYVKANTSLWGMGGTKDVSGLQAPDDETFVLKLTYPNAAILATLAHPCCGIVAKRAIEYYGEELSRRTVGTGPWRLQAIAEKRLCVLAPFDDYWDETWGGTNPDRITFAKFRSWNEYTEALKNGVLNELQLFDAYYDRVVADGRPAGALEGARGSVEVRDESGLSYLAFNMDDPVWGAMDDDGRGLRRAVSLAFNYESFAAKAYGAHAARAPKEILPPDCGLGEVGRHEDWGRRDLEAAKKELDATRYKGGLNPDTGKPLALRIVANRKQGWYVELLEALEPGLKELGIETETVWSDQPRELEAIRASGDWHLDIGAWSLDHPDVTNYLQLFSSRGVGSTSEFRNIPRYRSQAFDDAWTKLLALPPYPENFGARAELASSLVEELRSDRPVIPLAVFRNEVIRGDGVVWPALPAAAFQELRYLRLAEGGEDE